MRIISINMEGKYHLERVGKFLRGNEADVVCLTECPKGYGEELKKLGYLYYSFQENRLIDRYDPPLIEGNLIASKVPHNVESFHYYKHNENLELKIEEYDTEKERLTNHQGFLMAELELENVVYRIGVTHFTWTPDGATAQRGQVEDMKSFKKLIDTMEPHIMCGDFNIPRHLNPLYDDLASIYVDNIPDKYTSSIDKDLHKHKDNPELNHLFTQFMVDYVFTQPPYTAKDVRLEFGISDHAAVIAEIEIAQ